MSSGMSLPHAGIEAEIEDVRFGTVFVFQYCNSLGRNNFRNRIVGISQIRNPASTERAALDTCRLHALADPVVAEVALIRDFVLGMEETHAVRACHDAVATAYAPIPVNQYDTVVRLIGCADRAYLDARRVVALIAEFRHKECFGNILRIDLLVANQVRGVSIPPTHW